MSEIALISARKNRLESAAKKGNQSAQAALDLANSPNKFLSTVQIGITLIGILTGGFDISHLSLKVGAAELKYGNFLQTSLTFFIIAFSLFMVITDSFKF